MSNQRLQEVVRVVMNHMRPFGMICLERSNSSTVTRAAYAVTINRNEKSFEERITEMWEILSHALTEGESLSCENSYFYIVRDDYELVFLLEGYKKHAQMIGYMENGQPKQSLMYRMSSLNALRLMRKRYGREFVVKARQDGMADERLRLEYPNPGDRFVAIYKTEKWRRK